VGAIAAHPYQIPYACPAAFERRFKAADPGLHARLRAAEGNEGGRVSWREVQHWMWPLFTERWAGFRQERLGLPPAPLMMPLRDGSGGSTALLPRVVHLLYGECQATRWMQGL